MRDGPRRFTISTINPLEDGRNASRNSAGEASCATVKGRTITNNVSLDCAARCRRRNDDDWAYGIQKINAPQLPARRICSADHRASPDFGALTCSRRSSDSPMYPSPNPLGTCGGCNRAIGRSPSALRAGCSNRISPIPACCTSRSTNAPSGQPPPGNSADNAGYPVSNTRARPPASCEARHNDGWMSSARREAASIGHHDYCISIQHLTRKYAAMNWNF